MNGIPCVSSSVDDFPGQDGEHGTDTTDNDPSDGRAGFSFTKLDGVGRPLADQSVSYDVQIWSCVRDEVTGLVWEVKRDDTGLRDRNWTYSWYNSGGIDDGGASGSANGGVCIDDESCDTEKFLAQLNDTSFCGADDWRLPTRGELLSIVDFGVVDPPSIDTDYFPNALATFPYWSRTTGYSPSLKLTVAFHDGNSTNSPASRLRAIRAVRGGN